MESIIVTLLCLAIILPIGAFFISKRKFANFKCSLLINVISFFGILIISSAFMVHTTPASTATVAETGGIDQGLKYLAAALSTGLAALGAGIATGQASSSALGALSENEGIMGKALIFVALSEGIAIYGLLVTFMILNG